MRILHLSDLHYGKKYKNKIGRMFPYFLKKIKEINQENKINLIIFSGDLVWSGNKFDNFEEVEKIFIKPVLNEITLDKDNFIICPGNHDMSGQEELPAIKDYINKFDNNDDLDKFIEDSDKQFDLSYEKSNNYYKFVRKIYHHDNIKKLYQTYQREIENKKIGIVSFHTPWRCFKSKNTGHLLLPRKVIYDAFVDSSLELTHFCRKN